MTDSFNPTRRRWLQGTALAGASQLFAGTAAMLSASTAFSQDRRFVGQSMTLLTYGGSWLDVVREVVITPFQAQTGAKVIVDDSCCDKFGPAMKMSKFTADVVCGLDESAYRSYVEQNWTADLSALKAVELAAGVDPKTASSRYAALQMYDFVMATGDKTAPLPGSWQDFWNTEKFPGARGLIRDDPSPALEIALLADGVSPGALYPLDVDRAFASLDKLRKKTRVNFAASGAEQINLLATGETKYSVVYSNRVASANHEGVNIRSTYAGALMLLNGAIIPKTAKNIPLAIEFIKFYLRPEVLAAFAEKTGMAPITPAGTSKVSPQKQASMPSSPGNRAQSIAINTDYWAKNRAAIYERWTAWLTQ